VAKAKILVVDDDNAMRELMRLSLSKEGFEVRAAASSNDALSAVSEDTFDVIVTDIYLGDGTGLDLLEYCRTHLPEANVILVTAHGTIETAASARRLGVFDYLAKPFAVDALVARVRAALRSADLTPNRVELGPDSMIIGNDPSIVEVYNTVARVAPLLAEVIFRIWTRRSVSPLLQRPKDDIDPPLLRLAQQSAQGVDISQIFEGDESLVDVS